MEAAVLPATRAAAEARRWASIAAAVAQPFVEAVREAEWAKPQPASWRSAARIDRRAWARCCLPVVRPKRFPPSTCALAQFPAAAGRVPPARVIPAIERVILPPAEAVGRSSAVAHAQPAAVCPAAV
jgi:hypothetical protein